MKSLTEYITESTKIKNLGFSDAEILTDLEVLNGCPENNDKKILAAKYGLSTRKAGEIMQACYLQLRSNRAKKKTFTSEDVQNANRIGNGIPSVYNKFVEFMKEEPAKFVEFYRDYLLQSIKACGNGLEKVYTLHSNRNIDMNYRERALCKWYDFTLRYLEESGISVKPKNAEEVDIESLKMRLLEDMKPFHDLLMTSVEKYARKFWKDLPSYIKSLEKEAQAAKKKYYDIDSEMCNYWNNHSTDDVDWKKKYMDLKAPYKIAKADFERKDKKLTKHKNILKKFGSEAKYVQTTMDEAEQDYAAKVAEIANRVKYKGLVLADTKVTQVRQDPKFFELTITDGKKNIFCRSVRAAEFSVKMIPHFRFIITERK